MRTRLWLVGIVTGAFLACSGGSSVDSADADQGPSTATDADEEPGDAAVASTACSDEVADGYPSLSRDGCAAHVSFRFGDAEQDLHGETGLVEMGSGLATLSASDFELQVPLQGSGEQAFDKYDCAEADFRLAGSPYRSSYSDGALTGTLYRDGDLVWGDFEGEWCADRGSFSAGEGTETAYDCRPVSNGKFAAFVEAAPCDSACDGEPALSVGQCEMPVCLAIGICDRAYCPLAAGVCQAYFSAPDGVFAGAAHPVFELYLEFEDGALTLARVTDQAQSIVYAVEHDPPKPLVQDNGRWVIAEPVFSDSGEREGRLILNVITQATAAGDVLHVTGGDFSDENSTWYFDDFELERP